MTEHAACRKRCPKALDDAAIRQAVIDELFRGPHTRAGAIIVACTDGVGELTGTVSNLLAKDRAVAITEAVRGVRAVSDRVRVEPTARADADIAKGVDEALRYDPAADSYQVSTSATQGVVRVTVSWTPGRKGGSPSVWRAACVGSGRSRRVSRSRTAS